MSTIAGDLSELQLQSMKSKQHTTPPAKQQARTTDNKSTEPKTRPKLKREVQSTPLLAEGESKSAKPAQPKRLKHLEEPAATPAAPVKAKGSQRCTASKAKAHPKDPKQEAGAKAEEKGNDLSVAVKECLSRKDTTEHEHGHKAKDAKRKTATDTKAIKPDSKTKSKAKPTRSPSAASAEPVVEDSDHEETDQDDEEARDQVRRRKDAHARFMRFSRSLKSNLAKVTSCMDNIYRLARVQGTL